MPSRGFATTAALTLTLASSAFAEQPSELLAEVRVLRLQVAALESALRERNEMLEAMKREISALGDDVAWVKERVASPALPFLSGPPPSSDGVGVAKVAVFAPRVEVDSTRSHSGVSLKLRRVEAGSIRPVAEVELGADELGVNLPLDQNGALYIVDWSTSEGHAYTLLLRDGAGAREATPTRELVGGPPAASVQVKPLQSQGRFIFVGYRVE